jgi:hypothetical protein
MSIAIPLTCMVLQGGAETAHKLGGLPFAFSRFSRFLRFGRVEAVAPVWLCARFWNRRWTNTVSMATAKGGVSWDCVCWRAHPPIGKRTFAV